MKMRKTAILTILVFFFLISVQTDVFAAGNSAEALYEEGMQFFEQGDYDRAYARFQISGDAKGYAPAQNMLGICYRDGLGTEQDITDAERYFRLSAAQGYAPAQENLLALEQEKYDVSEIQSAIIDMCNEQRAKLGLPAFSFDSDLQLIADVRALDQLSRPSHTRPDGSGWESAFPEDAYYYLGENLYSSDSGKTEEDLVSSCINKWMEVKEDKANILNPYYMVTAVGVSVSEEKMYIVQLFGTPYI